MRSGTVRDPCYVGVDVGTEGVRAGVFSAAGAMLAMASHPIRVFRPAEDHVEQSSEEIWKATCIAVKEAVQESGAKDRVRGIGFDATCSLVVLARDGTPLSVSRDPNSEADVIVWMDHRARDEAHEITKGAHAVLRYVGGVMSPEMQLPKLLWMRRHMPDRYRRVGKVFDLADFLVYRATGEDVRSTCTVTCKWTYLAHERRWDPAFLAAIGLADLFEGARVGTSIADPGSRAGKLLPTAAHQMGLPAGTAVAVAMIDAHSGGIGMCGADREGTLGVIGGTSSCHMALSREPVFVPGVWGPYYGAMLPGFWLNEGGQSATGALVDHVIQSCAGYPALAKEAGAEGRTVYQLLNEEVMRLEAEDPDFHRDVHMLGYLHGNRSPRADPDLRGMVSGLSLSRTRAEMARLYLAAIRSIAYGTRHIIEAMNAAGHRITKVRMCGGGTKNPLWVREHADATGCEVTIPRESEAMLLGSAMCAAAASGDVPSVEAAATQMGADVATVRPRAQMRDAHDRKYRVFHEMHADQLKYRAMMRA